MVPAAPGGGPHPGGVAPGDRAAEHRRREVDPNELAIITVGAFLAGEAPNVIPASAELRLTVRARSEAVRAQLRDRITAVAQAQAAVHGARAEVDYRWRYPVTMNDREATRLGRGAGTRLCR
jgi:hippurate hydrolase